MTAMAELLSRRSRRGRLVPLGYLPPDRLQWVDQRLLPSGRVAQLRTFGIDSDSALRRRLRHYATPDILLIDEVGYLSYSNRHADLLFELVNQRYEARSTIVTTNKPFAKWSEVFPDAACVVSLVDLLVHCAEVISIEGESYRLKEACERNEARPQQQDPQACCEEGDCVMSYPLLPSGRRRGLPFVVPDDWTPEQVLAVFELLEDLFAVVTDFFGAQLHELLREQRSAPESARTRERDPPL